MRIAGPTDFCRRRFFLAQSNKVPFICVCVHLSAYLSIYPSTCRSRALSLSLQNLSRSLYRISLSLSRSLSSPEKQTRQSQLLSQLCDNRVVTAHEDVHLQAFGIRVCTPELAFRAYSSVLQPGFQPGLPFPSKPYKKRRFESAYDTPHPSSLV